MDDNDGLKNAKEKFNGLENPDLEQAGNQPKEEIKKPQEPPVDFKIMEVWIKNGNIWIEASQTFWSDKCRALGVLEWCKDIVKEARVEPEKKIITPGNGGFRNFVNRMKRKR